MLMQRFYRSSLWAPIILKHVFIRSEHRAMHPNTPANFKAWPEQDWELIRRQGGASSWVNLYSVNLSHAAPLAILKLTCMPLVWRQSRCDSHYKTASWFSEWFHLVNYSEQAGDAWIDNDAGEHNPPDFLWDKLWGSHTLEYALVSQSIEEGTNRHSFAVNDQSRYRTYIKQPEGKLDC